MAIPAVTENVRSDGLNQSPPVAVLPVVIGRGDGAVAVNTFDLYSDANALKDAAGDGMGVLQGVALLAKGGPIGFVRCNASVAAVLNQTRGTFTEVGTAGAVGETPAGSGPTITVDASGATRSCEIDVEVETAGTLGTMAFRVRVDGGAYGTPVTSAAAPNNTYTVPDTGVVVTFPAGTYVDETVYDVEITQGGGEIALTGTPNYDVEGRIEIVSDGERGEATFKFALDCYSGDKTSERTYSEVLTIPASGTYAFPGQGVTATFADEDFFAGDVYTFTATAASLNATNLADAFAPLIATEIPWRFCVVATGEGTGDATAHALLATALQAQLASLASLSVYRRGMVATGGDTGAEALAAFSSVSADRALCAYGKARVSTVKPLPGYAFPTVPAVSPIAARASESLISTDLKRTRSGALSEVVKLFHDELKNPTGLETIRVSTLRTWRGRGSSAYVTQAFLKSAIDSSFKLWPHGLVVDVACEVAHDELIEAIGRGLRSETRVDGPNTYPGIVDRRDANSIETEVVTRLNSALITPVNAEGVTGHIQAVRFTISNTHNFLQTGVVVASLGVLPLGYVDFVETDVGFILEV